MAGKSGAGDRTWYKRSSLISAQTPKTKIYKIKTSGYKTRRTPEHILHIVYKETITDKDNEGEQRVKYTTCNVCDWNQV